MIDYKSQREEIRRVKEAISRTQSPHRRRDMKRYLTRLNREMSEAKKWERSYEQVV